MGNSVSATAVAGSNNAVRLADPGKELLRCAEQGDTHIVSWILACDAQYLAHSSVFGGNTAWHKAAKTGKVEVLETMEGIVAQQFQRAAQHAQPCKGDMRVGLLRLGASPADVIRRLINKANMKGITPLMLACIGRHTETVAWLLKHGADVWRHDRVRRHTALHCAAQNGATDAIRLLLAAAGADVHPVNGKRLVEQGNHAGLTALHYAVFCDQQEVMQQLVAADADITVQAEFPDLDWGSVNAGDTAMHIAANKGNIDSIQILLRAYNEKSGSMMPGSGLPRRVRDPRAMRNDYGRLPYHVAVRKGYSWLAEMLDPSVPVRYILAGEELTTDTTWGPPRLATIAASVLHQALVTDLKLIKEITRAEEAAAAGADPACDSPATAVARAEAAASPEEASQQASTTAEQCESSELDTTAAAAAAAAAAADDNNGDAAPGQRRRWSLSMHRRSSSFGTGGRPASRGSAAAAAESPARPSSRRAAHSRRGSRGAGEFGPPPSPLSPRILMSVMLGGASGHDQQDDDSAAVSPKPHLSEGVGLGELSLQLPTVFSRNKAVDAAVEGDATKQQQAGVPQVASTSALSMADIGVDCFDTGADWAAEWNAVDTPRTVQEVAAVSDIQQQEREQQACCQHGGSASPRLDAASQPWPSSSQDCGQSSAAQALLQQCRWAGVVSPGPPEADGLGEDGQTCGVCLDALPNACIVPCKHTMCADCATDMCERFSLATAVCPFCRCVIRGFAPTNLACLADTQNKPASA